MRLILGISGSLRERSFNTALLREAERLAPEDVAIEVADLSGIPLYNRDLEAADGYPEKVADFRKAIRGAEAILIATPEYNFSVPGATGCGPWFADYNGVINNQVGIPSPAGSSENRASK